MGKHYYPVINQTISDVYLVTVKDLNTELEN
jgi:hypothetical protein